MQAAYSISCELPWPKVQQRFSSCRAGRRRLFDIVHQQVHAWMAKSCKRAHCSISLSRQTGNAAPACLFTGPRPTSPHILLIPTAQFIETAKRSHLVWKMVRKKLCQRQALPWISSFKTAKYMCWLYTNKKVIMASCIMCI